MLPVVQFFVKEFWSSCQIFNSIFPVVLFFYIKTFCQWCKINLMRKIVQECQDWFLRLCSRSHWTISRGNKIFIRRFGSLYPNALWPKNIFVLGALSWTTLCPEYDYSFNSSEKHQNSAYILLFSLLIVLYFH